VHKFCSSVPPDPGQCEIIGHNTTWLALTWPVVLSANTYYISYAVNGIQRNISTRDLKTTVSNLIPGSQYTFFLKAYGSAESAVSNCTDTTGRQLAIE